MPIGLTRLTSPVRNSGPGAAKPDTSGKVYTASGFKPGSTAVLYANGSQIGSVTVDGTGKATWTLANAPAGGSIITFDAVVVGTGGVVVGGGGPVTPPPASITIPVISVAPVCLCHVKQSGSTWTGGAVRLVRVSDSAQADIPFDSYGRIDMAAARTFAGTNNLTYGVLNAITSYDTSGNSNHITWSTGAAAVPFVSERDAYGAAYTDRAMLGIQSQKYAFNGISQVQRTGTLPSGFSINSQNLAAFMVAAPMQSLQRNAIFTIGTTTGAGRITLYVEGSSGNLGLGSLGTTGGTAGTDTKAPFSMIPRTVAQVMSVISRPGAGKIIRVEDRSFTGSSVEDSRTLTGGGIGVTGGGNTYFLDADMFAFAIYPSTMSDGEATQIGSAMTTGFETARRSSVVMVCGSSTPEGQGATFGRSYSKLMAGMLTRQIDLLNPSLSGQTLADIANNASARYWPALAGYSAPILLIDGAANDFLQNATDTATYNVLKNFIAAFKAQFPNGKVIVVTPTGKSNATTAQDNYRTSYNTMVRNNKSDLGYDVLFDRAAIPQAQNLSDATYFRVETDGSILHATDALHAIYAQGAAQAVQGLLQ